MPNITVDEYSWMLDPDQIMKISIKDGEKMLVKTPPCCWGPMITPDHPGGHEVSAPVRVEGAEPGDAVVLTIEKIKLLSNATTSGTDKSDTNHYAGEPSLEAKCPQCQQINPETELVGTGPKAIRCCKCGAVVAPYQLANGYTMIFDNEKKVGVTVNDTMANLIRQDAAEQIALPEHSSQYPVNILARGRETSLSTRVDLMIGNIGTLPSIKIPPSQNIKDRAWALVEADHGYSLDQADLEKLTDGHMDINEVREGAILIAPVEVPGAGIYVGDVHAMQGDGELAGHTTDVSAEITIKVNLIKGLKLAGPILLPLYEDLPRIIRPLDDNEWEIAVQLAKDNGFILEDLIYPIEVVGTGKGINDATENGLRRLSQLTGWDYDEVRNRATITGGVRIGRIRGVVQVGVLISKSLARKIGIDLYLRQQYGPYISAARI